MCSIGTDSSHLYNGRPAFLARRHALLLDPAVQGRTGTPAAAAASGTGSHAGAGVGSPSVGAPSWLPPVIGEAGAWGRRLACSLWLLASPFRLSPAGFKLRLELASGRNPRAPRERDGVRGPRAPGSSTEPPPCIQARPRLPVGPGSCNPRTAPLHLPVKHLAQGERR
jgi:hypothetical protein